MKNYIKDFRGFALTESDGYPNAEDWYSSDEPFRPSAGGSSQEAQDHLTRALSREGTSPRAISNMISNGADPNGYDSEGRTPLMAAIKTAAEGPVKVLLDMGADPNLKFQVGRSSMTPLGYAEYLSGWETYRVRSGAGRGMEEIIRLLIEAGAE